MAQLSYAFVQYKEPLLNIKMSVLENYWSIIFMSYQNYPKTVVSRVL